MQMPDDLGSEGQKLWQDIAEGEDSWSEDIRPDEYRILELACRALDDLDEMRQTFEGQGREWVVKGSTGQPVINPLKSEIRFLTATFAALVKQLAIPDTEERALARADEISRKMTGLARRSHGPGSRRGA
jgi:hypothetical protein